MKLQALTVKQFVQVKMSFDENVATTELLADEVRKLEAQGYDVTATLKLKLPKE